MKLLRDIDVSGKRVFLRGDLDVNVEQLTINNSQLTEAARLQNLKPTVDYLLEHGARQIVIAGHIGRPSHEAADGKAADREKLSTKNLVLVLEKLLGRKIAFQADSGVQPLVGVGPLIVLLENLRFWDGEEKNEPEFAKILASLADVYVNDAFGVCHRNHASIAGVPAILPHAAGLHLEQEIIHLTESIKDPQRPFVAIVGGAKIETKVPVIENLAKIANTVLVGGELALQGETLRGYGDRVSIARLTEDGKDIDGDSIKQFTEIIKGAKTVIWNGPMGLFEEGFEAGTMAIAEAVIHSGSFSVVGGGETTQFLGLKNLLDKFSFVSSGGGAMLEFLSGKELPGIKALE